MTTSPATSCITPAHAIARCPDPWTHGWCWDCGPARPWTYVGAVLLVGELVPQGLQLVVQLLLPPLHQLLAHPQRLHAILCMGAARRSADIQRRAHTQHTFWRSSTWPRSACCVASASARSLSRVSCGVYRTAQPGHTAMLATARPKPNRHGIHPANAPAACPGPQIPPAWQSCGRSRARLSAPRWRPSSLASTPRAGPEERRRGAGRVCNLTRHPDVAEQWQRNGRPGSPPEARPSRP
jgi:hypothetical protein